MAIKRCIPVMEMACLRMECHKPTQFESQNGWAVRVRCLPAGDLLPQYIGSVHELCVLLWYALIIYAKRLFRYIYGILNRTYLISWGKLVLEIGLPNTDQAFGW